MSCIELPICQGEWKNQLSFKQAFELVPPSRDSYEFGHLPHDARVTIHVSHRIGALVTSLYILWLALLVLKNKSTAHSHKNAKVMLLILSTQVALGISNIWFALPLSVAVAHNLVAAALMLSMISLSYKLHLHTLPMALINWSTLHEQDAR